MSKPKTLGFKPHARLLTMLGDQLIRNERIALVELAKNSYDADATWAKITFANFGEGLSVTPDSKIIVEDDGVGMSAETITNDWTTPATPMKLIAKNARKGKTARGRLIQGEKGIGRFAILKLGRKAVITTRTASMGADENVLTMDFSEYDDDFLRKGTKAKSTMLADLELTLEVASPARVIRTRELTVGAEKVQRPKHGTRIEISHLRGDWTHELVAEVHEDTRRMHSSTVSLSAKSASARSKFSVAIHEDARFINVAEDDETRLEALLDAKAPLRITDGRYDEGAKSFEFDLNGTPTSISLLSPEIMGLNIFKRLFGAEGQRLADGKSTKCGGFGFEFAVFDFAKSVPQKYTLEPAERKLLKRHRVYLYRDGVRVYPYGDASDDWLQIDVFRGTSAAGDFLSNDQVVGQVSISQLSNAGLRDKTNREGLIDSRATTDFISLLQVFLRWLRAGPYERYRRRFEQRERVDLVRKAKVDDAFQALEEKVASNAPAKAALGVARKLYETERRYLTQRAETTEQLAGVGLSVETAAHDIMSVMQRAMNAIDGLVRESLRAAVLDKTAVMEELTSLRGMLSFIETQLRSMQQFFRSSKQRRKDIRVRETLDKVHRIFGRSLDDAGIKFEIRETGSPLVAKTTDAVLLQLFLNLIDNAVYWLQTKRGDRRILVQLDGDEQQLVFSDNGPGIPSEDRDYVFDPFFSGKGEEGRGLGLYIARQLLDRHDYSIALADLRSQKQLNGASFVVSFVREDSA